MRLSPPLLCHFGTHLCAREEAIFKEVSGEFTVRVATKPDEVKELLEVDFDYVCEKDGLMYFRNRK